MRGRSQGFTLVELMVAMAVAVIGFVGIVALHTTTVRANRQSRQLERAGDLVQEVMEDLRSTSTAKIVAGVPRYPDVVAPDGVTYRRAYVAAPVTGQPTLVVVSVTVSYADDEDATVVHTQRARMVRTTLESL